MMIEAKIDDNTNGKGARFFVGLMLVGVGYLTASIGCVAFFKIPLGWTFGLMLGGLLVATTIPFWLDCRLAFVQTGIAFFATYIIGAMLIAGIMVLFGNSTWKSWYFHPAGFQSTWLVLVAASFHLAAIQNLPSQESLAPTSLIPITMINKRIIRMHHQCESNIQRTKKPLHPSCRSDF